MRLLTCSHPQEDTQKELTELQSELVMTSTEPGRIAKQAEVFVNANKLTQAKLADVRALEERIRTDLGKQEEARDQQRAALDKLNLDEERLEREQEAQQRQEQALQKEVC